MVESWTGSDLLPFQDTILLLGGWTGLAATADIHELDTETDQWVLREERLPHAKLDFQVLVLP